MKMVKVTTEVERPSNVPISPNRWTMQGNFKYREAVADYNLNPPQWPFLKTLVGLDIPRDIELDDNTWLIRLTDADAIELRLHISQGYSDIPMIFNPLTHAVCYREQPQDLQGQFSKLIRALRLFKSGYIECGLDFEFQRNQSGHTLQDKIPYRISYPKLMLNEADLPELLEWWNHFQSIDIVPGSVMDRALGRFERTYVGNPHERTTDAVISLETLLMPTRQGEINYRVAQRAGFLLSNDPVERIEIASKVRMHTTYGVVLCIRIQRVLRSQRTLQINAEI